MSDEKDKNWIDKTSDWLHSKKEVAALALTVATASPMMAQETPVQDTNTISISQQVENNTATNDENDVYYDDYARNDVKEVVNNTANKTHGTVAEVKGHIAEFAEALNKMPLDLSMPDLNVNISKGGISIEDNPLTKSNLIDKEFIGVDVGAGPVSINAGITNNGLKASADLNLGNGVGIGVETKNGAHGAYIGAAVADNVGLRVGTREDLGSYAQVRATTNDGSLGTTIRASEKRGLESNTQYHNNTSGTHINADIRYSQNNQLSGELNAKQHLGGSVAAIGNIVVNPAQPVEYKAGLEFGVGKRTSIQTTVNNDGQVKAAAVIKLGGGR